MKFSSLVAISALPYTFFPLSFFFFRVFPSFTRPLLSVLLRLVVLLYDAPSGESRKWYKLTRQKFSRDHRYHRSTIPTFANNLPPGGISLPVEKLPLFYKNIVNRISLALQAKGKEDNFLTTFEYYDRSFLFLPFFTISCIFPESWNLERDLIFLRITCNVIRPWIFEMKKGSGELSKSRRRTKPTSTKNESKYILFSRVRIVKTVTNNEEKGTCTKIQYVSLALRAYFPYFQQRNSLPRRSLTPNRETRMQFRDNTIFIHRLEIGTARWHRVNDRPAQSPW